MFQHQNNQTSTRKETTNILYDSNGNPLLEIGQQQFAVRTSTGELIHRSINESILLADGTLWSPLMLLEKPPVHLGICDECQQKPPLFRRSKISIITIRRAKRCTCGKLLCPHHAKLKSNRWLCPSCARKYKLTRLIRPVFFKER